jgi:hypothetical protein
MGKRTRIVPAGEFKAKCLLRSDERLRGIPGLEVIW